MHKKSEYKNYIEYSSIGIEVAASIIAGFLIGYWLDQKLGTRPWLLIFWVFCGIASAVKSLYRMIKKIERNTCKLEATIDDEKK